MAEGNIYSVGLDAGSAYTRAVIGVLEGGRLRFLGYGEARSEGWVKGRIADQRAVVESLRSSIREAERLAQTSVESVVVGVGGAAVRGANSRSVIEVGRPREIEERDVRRAIQRAGRVHLDEESMVLQLCPQDFVVDDRPGLRNPRRMVASRIEANVHLITVPVLDHNTLVGAANLASLTVEETVYEPLASCYAAVLPEDRREGIALVDIGAHSTDMVVYFGDCLQLASSLAICGDHFTRDVARGLCIGYEDAAQVKEEYGWAHAGLTAGNSFIELPSGEEREWREAPRRTLNQILEARAHELFEYVRRELARVGMDQELLGGLVLTGGAARLPGMCDVAERVLNCQARKGLALGIEDWPEVLDDVAWTTAAGLAMYSARLKMHGELERQSGGLLARMLR